MYLFIIVIVLTAFSKNCFCQADTNELIKVQIDSLSDQAISVTGYITDSLVKNLRLPGEYGGVSPLDVCYVGYGSINKLYVYGDHRILIYNASDLNLLGTLDISDYGHFSIQTRNESVKEKRLTFNTTDHKLYCLTEQLEIKVINTDTDVIVSTIAKPSGLPDNFNYAILKHCPISNKLFCSVTCLGNDTTNGTYLYIYNSSNSLIQTITFDDVRVNDIAFNQVYNFAYISNGFNISIYQYNGQTYTLVNTITMDGWVGTYCYVRDDAINAHYIYWLPMYDEISSNKICRINANDNTYTILTNDDFHDNYTCASYDPTFHKMYLAYAKRSTCYFGSSIDVYDYRYNIINGNLEIPEGDNYVYDMVTTSNSHKTFCATKDKMVVIESGQMSLTLFDQYGYNLLYNLAYNANGQKVYVANYAGSSIEVFNEDGTYSSSKITGTRGALYGCYNSTNHKKYFYEKGFGDNSKIFILNAADDVITTYNIGKNLTGCVYDAENNLIYVSSGAGNVIKMINGETDAISDKVITLTHGNCKGLLWASDNKLYCPVKTPDNHVGVEIWDLNSYTNYFIEVNDIVMEEGKNCNAVLCRNGQNNEVYVTFSFPATNIYDILLIIDGSTNSLINRETISKHSYKMICDSNSNKLFILYEAQSYVSMIDRNNILPQMLLTCTNTVLDIDLSEDYTRLFMLYNNMGISHLKIIDYSNVSYNSSNVDIGGFALSVKYNPINKKLYFMVPINHANNDEMEVWAYDYSNQTDLGYFSLKQKEKIHGAHSYSYFERGSFILNDVVNDNRIYYCSAHGNINVIQCTRNEIPLDQATWKWLSFPRLQRTGNEPVNAQTLLSTITPFPEGINFLGLYNPTGDGINLNYDQITNWTSNGLSTIQSTLGYKIYTTDSDNRKSILPTPGTVLDAGTSVTIYSNHDNWIGYFLPNSQMPADAFGTVMMNKLKMIKTQNWTMTKVNGVWIGSSGIVPFKYGDMVVVNYEDHLFQYTTFAWQNINEAEDTEMVKAENFTYTETSDYVPIYVEVDSADHVKEIAAYVDDVCVGAAVAGDTLVEVNAYISDTVPAGSDIELVKYYGTKSTLSYVKDYWVYNPVTFSKEKRKLKTGGKADYYMVSFKNKEVMTFTDKPSLTCYPNPFRTTLTFNYTLPYETNVTLNIYNLNGALVSTLVNGRQSKGSFDISWDGTNDNGMQLPNGIYIARLTTGKDVLQSKITLIK